MKKIIEMAQVVFLVLFLGYDEEKFALGYR